MTEGELIALLCGFALGVIFGFVVIEIIERMGLY